MGEVKWKAAGWGGPQHGQGAADQGHQKEHPGEQEELLGRNGRLGERRAEWEGEKWDGWQRGAVERKLLDVKTEQWSK